MDSIHVTFADGNAVDVRPGTRVVELAASAGAKNLVAAKIDGKPVDLNRVIWRRIAPWNGSCRTAPRVSMCCAIPQRI